MNCYHTKKKSVWKNWWRYTVFCKLFYLCQKKINILTSSSLLINSLPVRWGRNTTWNVEKKNKKNRNSLKILSKDLRSGVRPLRAEGVAADSFPLAARLPFRAGMAAAVEADCSGPLVVGVSAAPDSGIGRVMEVRRTLDFCTWKMIFEKIKRKYYLVYASKVINNHFGVPNRYRMLRYLQ